jgi:hypothetical protein
MSDSKHSNGQHGTPHKPLAVRRHDLNLRFLLSFLVGNALVWLGYRESILASVSPNRRAWIEDLRVKYDVKGLSIAIVASPTYARGGGKWHNETLSFGIANGTGGMVDPDVSQAESSFADPIVDLRNRFPLEALRGSLHWDVDRESDISQY